MSKTKSGVAITPGKRARRKPVMFSRKMKGNFHKDREDQGIPFVQCQTSSARVMKLWHESPGEYDLCQNTEYKTGVINLQFDENASQPVMTDE